MSDHRKYPKAPLLVPDSEYREGVYRDGWRVVFPTDAAYDEEYTAALHAHTVYGEPVRYATEDDIAAEVAHRAERATA